MWGWVNPTSMVPRVADGPKPPENEQVSCCCWCGRVIAAGCPSDDFDGDSCEQRWREWRNGAVPEAPPIVLEWTHRDGVPWDEAPVPDQFHVCEPWSTARGGFRQYCACGALRLWDGGEWVGRNTRVWRDAA